MGSHIIRTWTGRGAQAKAARLAASVLEVVLLGVLAVLTARLIWLVAYGASASDMDIALPQTVSGEAHRVADLSALQGGRLFAVTDMERTSDSEIIAPETALDLTLFGVRRGPDPQSGSAVIQASGSPQRSHAVGSEVIDGVMLEAVYPDRVTIRRLGIAESLYLREEARRNSSIPAGVTATDGVAAEFWTGIQVVPEFRDGVLAGYRLTEASRADLLSRTGLQAGDLITSINGLRIGSGTDIGRVMREVGAADRLQLEVERGGQSQTINVDPR
ncbi:MAG: hypothetical protein CMF74_19015 [Maricaulis sp.]|nr:hypothetical protein [Maricaulis sp.]MAL11741.1 hypothetical protein [Maricaulis sp.]HAQ33925.1 hypothetical protein [Alphaproteobacteria bacterium]